MRNAGTSKRHLICDSSGCVGEICIRGRNRRRGMGVTAMPLRWDGAFLILSGFGRRSFTFSFFIARSNIMSTQEKSMGNWNQLRARSSSDGDN